VWNLRDLEYLLNLEEATKKKAERVKTTFTGPTLRVRSVGDKTTIEPRYGASLPEPLGMKAPTPPPPEVRLLPIRPRSRGARRSLRTFPVVTLHPRFPFNV